MRRDLLHVNNRGKMRVDHAANLKALMKKMEQVYEYMFGLTVEKKYLQNEEKPSYY